MILNFKLFESIYIGKINLVDYSFKYNPSTTTGNFELKDNNGNYYDIEIKTNGKSENSLFDEFRIFSPGNKDFDLKELVDKIIYILNKNRLGYIFKYDKIIKPNYGLQPYAILTSDKPIEMENLEQLVASTKPKNKMVKKNGGFDQFTF
jgi:hypothetical protein